jgi:hypothetical protein
MRWDHKDLFSYKSIAQWVCHLKHQYIKHILNHFMDCISKDCKDFIKEMELDAYIFWFFIDWIVIWISRVNNYSLIFSNKSSKFLVQKNFYLHVLLICFCIHFTLQSRDSLCKIDSKVLEFIKVFSIYLENHIRKFLEE